MSPADDFWSAHDRHRQRINTYLTLALDRRFDELRITVAGDFGTRTDDTDLVIGLVGALATITEQAADAGGVDVGGYLQQHLLDVEEMINRRGRRQDELD